MRLILLLLLAFAVAGCDRQNPAGQQGEAAAGPVKGVDRSHRGKTVPDVRFAAPGGGDASLAEMERVPILMNLWATWCAPCVKELPTLDKLAAARAADGRIAIVAVSQDKAPQSSVEAFLGRHRLKHLAPYHDPDMKLSGALGVEVLPTTILFDAEGREVWRYVGDLDWTGKEAAKLLAEASAAPRG